MYVCMYVCMFARCQFLTVSILRMHYLSLYAFTFCIDEGSIRSFVKYIKWEFLAVYGGTHLWYKPAFGNEFNDASP